MKKIIWTGIKIHRSYKHEFVHWFLYCPPGNTKMFNLNLYMGFERGDKQVRDRNSNPGFLIKGDFNCRTGKRQLQLPLLFDVCEKWNAESYNSAEKIRRTRVLMQKKKN